MYVLIPIGHCIGNVVKPYSIQCDGSLNWVGTYLINYLINLYRRGGKNVTGRTYVVRYFV